MKTKTIAAIVSAALFPLAALAQPAPAPPAPPAPPTTPNTPIPPNQNDHDHDRAPKQPYTWLGVETSELPRVVSDQLGLPRGFGLVVDYVVPDGPAAQAGVQANDIMRMLNDQILTEPGQLSKLVRSYKEGDTVTLTVLRKGQEQKIQVKLAKHEVPGEMFRGRHGMPNVGMVAPNMDHMRDQLQRMQEQIKRQTQDAIGKVDFDAIRDTVREAKRQAMEARRQARELRIQSRDGNAMHSTRIDLNKAQVVYSDDKGEMRLEVVNGKKVLTAKDPQGRSLFSGPVDTKEEQDKMPPEVRERYTKLESTQLGGANGTTTFGFTTKNGSDDKDDDADDDDNDMDDEDSGSSMEQVNFVVPRVERSIEASVI